MDDRLRVQFVCIANDARSLIAEAVLRHADPEHFEAFSAGVRPISVDPRTLAILEHAGISVAGLRSKPLEEFAGMPFDYLIDLCDKGTDELSDLPQGEAEFQAIDTDHDGFLSEGEVYQFRKGQFDANGNPFPSDLYSKLSMDASAVDFLECAPDNWIGVGGSYGNALATLAERYPLSCHGLSLSLGGPMPLDHAFLRRALLYSLKAQGAVLGTQPEVTSLAISEGKTPSRWAL